MTDAQKLERAIATLKWIANNEIEPSSLLAEAARSCLNRLESFQPEEPRIKKAARSLADVLRGEPWFQDVAINVPPDGVPRLEILCKRKPSLIQCVAAGQWSGFPVTVLIVGAARPAETVA